ncbi:C-factor [Erythrobacter litoralis]|uniref:C-factor n=1 Tax=Erythrobacter litoralis TaxID=39960 RepID=A0A074N3A8_9SPHN|nr:SDR family NAD(P)-dependent oxidoreductase [Erythrobacter litoralis]KEO92447.1 C-factor [Erythrobacter litoralis]
MDQERDERAAAPGFPRRAAVFGASGGIGKALCEGLAQGGCEIVYAGSRVGEAPSGGPYRPFAFDLTREDTIKDAADAMKDEPPEWVIVASGVLTLSDGTGPERSYRHVEAASMAEVFALNTIGPALVAKHCLRLMPRKERFVFAALSARVGSISDNGIGGWHAYRASKAALNMLLKNYAIEMGRTHESGVVVGLHPGTVDTSLSQPFQKNLPEGQLTAPGDAAGKLLRVLAGLGPEDSGKVFDYAGKAVPA